MKDLPTNQAADDPAGRRVRLGVLGCSAFALRTMLPAAPASARVELVALASRSRSKAEACAAKLGGTPVEGYAELLRRDDVEAVYVPLPIGLHEEWVLAALAAGKHVLAEKSLATNAASADRMVDAARQRGLILVENYLFPHHSQTAWVRRLVLEERRLGDVHLVRSTFGFPPLPDDDIRYRADLGGGALLDAGGYPLRAARMLLGGSLELCGAQLCIDRRSGVDIFGDAQYASNAGQVAQLSFGFRHYYQCSLEVLGAAGRLTIPRMFTPPPGFVPHVRLEAGGQIEEIELTADNHASNMWKHFADLVRSGEGSAEYEQARQQAREQEQLRTQARRVIGDYR